MCSFSAYSAKRARILVIAAWVVAAAFSFPILFLNEERVVRQIKQCWIHMPEAWQWRVSGLYAWQWRVSGLYDW